MNRDVRAALLASVATAMTMLCLVPLLDGREWLRYVVLVVAAVGLAGAAWAAAGLPRWLTLPVTALAGLVISTSLLVSSQAALGGFLPTPTSLQALLVLVRSGLATTQTVVPPAPGADAGVLTLLTLAAGATAVLTLFVAGPLRRPGAAGLPLLLVVCVATALAPDGIGVLGYLGAGLGYLGMALTDGDRRVRTWGAVLGRRTRTGAPSSSGVAERLTATAATTAAVALLAGGLLPALLPGSGGDRLQTLVGDRFGEGGSEEMTTVNPLLDVRDDLESQDDTVLIRYATTDASPDPLRIVTADAFDGTTWAPSAVSLPPDQTVGGGLPAPPGASPEVLSRSGQVSTSIGIGPLSQSYLPLPYPASSVDVAGRWLYDPRTLNVIATDEETSGLTYAVTHYDITPDAATLAASPAAAIDPAWTQVPDDMSETVAAQAVEVVTNAGAGTAYDQALALQQWFRNNGGFAYSLDAPSSTDRDAVAAFLEDRRGYCVQFASTMSLMARTLGIPARVAVGFLPGEEVEEDRWEIRADDAHAWPELYFEGVGWVRFEPTPGTRTGLPPGWAVPESDPAVAAPSTAPSQAAPVPEAEQPTPEAVTGASVQEEGLTAAQLLAGAGRTAAVVLVLAGLACLPRLWRHRRTRRRLRRTDGDAGATAVAGWTELLERLADLDVRPDGATVREQAAWLVAHEKLGQDAREALARRSEAVERALYAVEPAPAGQVDDDVRTVLAEVAARQERRVQLAATWWPTLSPQLVVPRRAGAGERVGRR